LPAGILSSEEATDHPHTNTHTQTRISFRI
jgi:hypothetical protein